MQILSSSGFCATNGSSTQTSNRKSAVERRIETNDCSLCVFFGELGGMRADVGGDPIEGVWKFYKIIVHSMNRLIRAKNLSEPSVIFSLEPAYRRGGWYHRSASWDFITPGYTHGRYFSSPTCSHIRQPAGTIDYPAILGWLNFCTRNHTKSCGVAHMRVLPSFQVIDCYARIVVAWPTDTRPPYLTLSYSWGKKAKTILLHRGLCQIFFLSL